jgi:serine/threonine protein kinase
MDNIVYLSNGQKLTLLKQLGKAGGEGTVFLADDNTAVKLFNSKANLSTKERKIDLLLKSGIKDESLCIPKGKVYDKRNCFVGYNMSLAQGDTLQETVFIRTCLEKKFPDWSRINLSNLALCVLDKIQKLHAKNIIVGDVNPYNIIINSDREIYFIDTDSYQIKSFLCTVGTILFTPPELQGVDFKKVIRNQYDEYFSIAVLMFLIFLPGKNPFAYTGGGDLGATIRAQNFSYPLGEDDNLQAPKGIWEFIWNELNYDLRRAFYDVFRQGKRLNISNWKEVILSFKEDLVRGLCPKDIFPTQLTPKQEKYKALSLNRRNIHESNTRLRNDKTELSLNSRNPKIGILELSTTAVKLLIGDQEKINTQSFDFNHYSRFSDRTDTGSLLNADCLMDIGGFYELVIPAIKNRIEFAQSNRVDVLYTVATAAYRTAWNRNEIIRLIKDECGINVKILTKKEEALATLKAFLFSKPKDIVFDKRKNYMFIDQGGGSTEITVFKGQEIVETYSLNLGSTVLKNIFFKEATENTSFDKAFNDSEKLIKDRLRVYLRNYNPPNLDRFCISVGNAIIQATGGKTAFTKHGITLTVNDIRNGITEFDNNLRSKYGSISHLYDACEENKITQLKKEKKSDQVDNILISRLSLPMYLEIMERFKIEKVVVSNTGLFYGIFIDKFF